MLAKLAGMFPASLNRSSLCLIAVASAVVLTATSAIAQSVDPYTATRGAIHILKRQAAIGETAEKRRKRDSDASMRQQGRRGEMLVGSSERQGPGIDFEKYGLPPGGSAQGGGTAYRGAGVELFVASQCPHCEELESFLREEGVTLRVYDVEKDRVAEEDYLKNIGRGILPVTRVNGVVIRGLEAKKILAALGRTDSAAPSRNGGKSYASGLGPKDSFLISRNEDTSSVSAAVATRRGMGRRVELVMERYQQAVYSYAKRSKDPSARLVYDEVAKLEIEEALLQSIDQGTTWFGKNELSFSEQDLLENALAYINTAKRLSGIADTTVSEHSKHLLRMRRGSVERRLEQLRKSAALE